jgi:hypothetical protein
MSISSVAGAVNFSHLQPTRPEVSVPSKADGPADPLADLLKPTHTEKAATAPSSSDVTTSTFVEPPEAGPPFNPESMATLLQTQEQSADATVATPPSQVPFSQLDADGDGQVSASEFANIFGSGANKSTAAS